MDPNTPSPSQLPLNPTPDAGDQAQPSSPAAAAEKATDKRTARTASRSPRKGAAARTGARARRGAAPPEPTAIERLPMIMLTSRISDVNGRAVARRRLAMVAERRVEHLHDRGYARAATQAEIDAAQGQTLPLID